MMDSIVQWATILSPVIAEWRNGVMKEFQENKPERDYQLYSQFVKELQVIKQNLETNKKKLN